MAHNCTLKKILAALLCLCLLLGSVGVLAEDVANVTDKRGPSVYEVNFKQNKKTLYHGDTVDVSMKVRDRSGVNQINVEFYNEKQQDSIYFGLDYNPSTDLFEGSTKIASYRKIGTYLLNWIYAVDSFGNSTYFTNNSSSLGKFTLKYKAKAKVKINKNKKTVKPLDKIKFTVEVTDAPEGTNSIAVIMNNKEAGWNKYFYLYDKKDGKFEGEGSFGWEDNKGELRCDYPNGKYELSGVAFYDEDHNDIGIASASGQYVTLTGSYDPQNNDSEALTISSGKLKKGKGKTLHAGDTIKVEAKVKGKDVSNVTAYLYPNYGNWRYDQKTKISKSDNPNTIYINLKKSGSKWVGEYKLTKDEVNATYTLEIYAHNDTGAYDWKYFDDQYFTFEDKDYVTGGIESFVEQTVEAITGSAATDAQINDLGMQLAEGKATGVEIVKKVVESTTLSKEEKANKLALFMRGTEATAEEQAMDLEPLIDKLAASENFRELCNDSKILAGSFDKKADGLEIGISKPVKKIKLNKKTLNLKVKKSEWLSATVKPKDATAAGDLEWTSSDESVAKVSNWGEVTGVGAGECTITCKATDGSGVTAECKVTVKGKSKNSKNELKLAEPVEKVKLKVGESQRITLTNADMKVKWSSSDKSVAKVTSSGKIKAVGKGKCTITCEAEDGSKIEIPVKVK